MDIIRIAYKLNDLNSISYPIAVPKDKGGKEKFMNWKIKQQTKQIIKKHKQYMYVCMNKTIQANLRSIPIVPKLLTL